jgi:hypothetical protein
MGYHCEFKHGQVPDCTLDCQNGGECVVGLASPSEADYMSHRWSLTDIEEHMRCVCPPGFGGEFCEAPAEQCGEDGICLHGSKCVTTVQTIANGKVHTQNHCDCTQATDDQGNLYAGKFCEHEATVMCSDDDWNLFCTQGGVCKTNPIEGCSCPKGTAGYKCEFIIDNIEKDMVEDDTAGGNDGKDDDDDDVDDFDDQTPTRCSDGYCINGGFCAIEDIILEDGTHGTVEACDCSEAYTDEAIFAGPYCQYKSTSLCYSGEGLPESLKGIDFCAHHGSCNDDGSCDCPKGWTGVHCEIETIEINEGGSDDPVCGDSVCYNGGVCKETEVIAADGRLELTLHCDCSSAYDEYYSYAGTSCQFPSTTLCTKPGPAETMESALYCTNHGTCMDDPQLGCDCPVGFYGFSCEFERPLNDEDQDGIPDMEDTDEDVDYDFCGDDGLVCHNSGRCVTTITENQQTGAMETIYHCDCTTAFDDETAYLGDQCQYPTTSVCDPVGDGEPLSSALFCVNNGVCRDDAPGCDCPDGFEGLFCEFKSDMEDVMIIEDGEDTVEYEECGEDLICLNVSMILAAEIVRN